MPSQRRDGLQLIGAYVEEQKRAKLKRIALERGTTVAELIRDAVDRMIAEAPRTRRASRS